jgi:hypothetical protein
MLSKKHYSVIKSRRIRWTEHVVSMREMKNAYNILVCKPERKRSLGRTRPRWEGNLAVGLRVGSCGLDSFGLE